ncbi:MAG: VWA domain-containing protein, partial [Planctomycetales bacterium]|nr:VWA domain-containing protein [Planctomycetales bacterium]
MSSQPSRIDCELDVDLGRVSGAMNDLLSTVWNGNTHISAGMMQGIDVLTRPGRSRDHADRIMIVMTDGYQNRGNAVTAAGSCAANRITVHTITFGASADIALMGSVAAAGNGRHYHAANPEELREAFRELAAMLAIITE